MKQPGGSERTPECARPALTRPARDHLNRHRQGYLSALNSLRTAPSTGCSREGANNLDSPARQKLLADLQAGLAIPLTIRTIYRDTVLLDVDLPALTRLTVQRLSTVSDIKDAQLNYLLSIRTPEP